MIRQKHLRCQVAVINDHHVRVLKASHAKYAPAASKSSRAILLAMRCLLARTSFPLCFAAHQVSEAQAAAVGCCQIVQDAPHMPSAYNAHYALCPCMNTGSKQPAASAARILYLGQMLLAGSSSLRQTASNAQHNLAVCTDVDNDKSVSSLYLSSIDAHHSLPWTASGTMLDTNHAHAAAAQPPADIRSLFT